MLREFAKETITVSNVVKSLTAATYAASGGWGSATKALVQVFNASIRFYLDGTDPSSTTGFASLPAVHSSWTVKLRL